MSAAQKQTNPFSERLAEILRSTHDAQRSYDECITAAIRLSGGDGSITLYLTDLLAVSAQRLETLDDWHNVPYRADDNTLLMLLIASQVSLGVADTVIIGESINFEVAKSIEDSEKFFRFMGLAKSSGKKRKQQKQESPPPPPEKPPPPSIRDMLLPISPASTLLETPEEAMETLMHSQHMTRVFLLPVHSRDTSHWSLLAAYRAVSNSNQHQLNVWYTAHYDSIGGMHIENARNASTILYKHLKQSGVFVQPRTFDCYYVPSQPDSWSCGWRTCVAAHMIMTLVQQEGEKLSTDRVSAYFALMGNSLLHGRKIALHIFSMLYFLRLYMHRMAVRKRCSLFFDFGATTAAESGGGEK